jgi:hypothetical protein
MEANEIIRTVENAGGELWVAGETLRYRLPESASSLVDEIRVSKWELLDLLHKRPLMPAGVRLMRWEPAIPPVRLNGFSIVTNTEIFIRRTLEQMGARLAGNDWQAGNWSLTELIERLAAVGVTVALMNNSRRLQ